MSCTEPRNSCNAASCLGERSSRSSMRVAGVASGTAPWSKVGCAKGKTLL